MLSRKPAILILGASQMQLPAINIGKELGWTVIVADANRNAPGVAMADYFEHVDLKDREGMTGAARRHLESRGLDGVFTVGTDFSTTVAWVAEALELPGIPYETALNASDKARMRRVFQAAGLPSPAFVTIAGTEDPAAALKKMSLPVVIKPVDNMGARGVRRIDCAQTLESAVKDALSLSRSGRVIVEEYVEGPEFSLDAIIYGGDISLCGIADRHIFFPPYFVEMGHTMPTSFQEEDRKRVVDLFFSGISALGIDNGAAKGDIKLSAKGPVIGEIAARLSGGYMSGWTYPYSSGVRIIEAAMRIAVGLPPGPIDPVKCHTAAERAFISIPGTVQSVDLDLSKGNGIREVFCKVKPGDEVTFPSNNVEKCGNVIGVDVLRDRAVESAEEACRKVFIRLLPFENKTREFLFGGLCDWAPWAFDLANPENSQAYRSMPPAFSDLIEAVSSRRVAVLPKLADEPSADWHGERIGAAFDKVLNLTGFEAVGFDQIRSFDVAAVGSLFWKAFLRGGVQGGVWLLDTLVSFASKKSAAAEVMLWLS